MGENSIMKRKIKMTLILLLVLVIAIPLALVWFSFTETFIFSSNLRVTNFVNLDSAYIANVTESNRFIAHIYVLVENLIYNSSFRRIVFSICHDKNTELDSLSLRFATKPYVTSLFLEASSYEFSGLVFHQEGGDVLFSVKDMGEYGRGTITLDFVLHQKPNTYALDLTMDFSMHYLGFLQLATLKAHAYLNIPFDSPS